MIAVDHLLLGLAEAGPGQQALVRPIVVEPPQGELDLAVGEPQAQVIAGHRLQRMGLVEDHDVVLGQHAHAFHAEGQVGEVQGVVDHQDLGVAHPPPGLVVEAGGVGGALAAHAVGAVAGHFFPDRRATACRGDRRASRRSVSRDQASIWRSCSYSSSSLNRPAARPKAFFIRRRLR